MSRNLAQLDAPARPGDAAAAVHSEQALFRLDLGRSLQLHRRLAIGIALVGLVAAAAYLFRYWPIYSAQTLVYVQPTPAGAMANGQPAPYPYDPGTYDAYIAQQLVSITRADVLKDALGRLSADDWQKSGESDQDAIDRLRASLAVMRVDNSYQISITARSSKPQIAADMANAVAAAYIESTSHEQKAGDSQRMAILTEERDSVKKELADDRAEQAQLNAELGVAAIGAAPPEHYDADIAAIHDELVKARADRDQAEAQLAALGNGNSAAVNAETETAIAADPGLTSLKQALDQRRAALVTQMANLTPEHPLYKQDAAEIQQIDANIASATADLRAKAAQRVEQNLRTNLERAASVEASLNAELGKMTRAAASATPKLQRASDLSGDIARLQARFDALDQQLQNQVIQDAAPERAHVTTAAVPPAHPTGKSVIRNSAALVLGFCLLGLMAAVGAHKLDPHVYVASDVEQVLGFAPLAQLPDFNEVTEDVADEHVLRLSAALEHARKQGNLKSCIFTATGPGAGTTTIANHVRSVLEGIGRPAVLVDAMGSAPPRAADPAAQRGRGALALLQRLDEESRDQGESLILTDAAPLTLSAETEYLARNADCAIVIMESGVTTRAQLRATAGALQRLDVPAVGFVLNRIGLAKADPAFRGSVRAMEDHLRLQSRSMASEPVRTRHIKPEFSAAPAQPVREQRQAQPAQPQEPPPQPQVEEAQLRETQVWAPQVAARQVAKPAAEPVARPAAPAVQPPAAAIPPRPAIATPAPLPPPPPRPQIAQPAAAAVSQADNDIPWWLAETALPSQRVAAPLSRGREAQPSAAAFDPPASESRLSGLRNLLSPRGAVPQPPAAAESGSQPWAAAVEPQFARPEPPIFEPAPPASEETLYGPAQSYEPALEDPGTAFVPYADSSDSYETGSEVPQQPGSGSTLRVTTAPEFLPPRKSRLVRIEEEAAARRERRDTVDDIAILPSWRGQYRRRD